MTQEVVEKLTEIHNSLEEDMLPELVKVVVTLERILEALVEMKKVFAANPQESAH